MKSKQLLLILVAASTSSVVCGPSIAKHLAHIGKGMAVHLLQQGCPNTVSLGSCSPEERRRQKSLFGYDLGIDYYEHRDDRFVKSPQRAILYLHPWGVLGMPNKRHTHLLKMYNILPGDVITFNFPDGIWRWPLPVFHSSFGQLKDVLPALYTLNFAYEKMGLQAVDLFGYSRGGAVAINMAAVLHDDSGEFDTELARIGIDAARKKELLAVIQRGTIVVDCPLVDGNDVLSHYPRSLQFFAKTCTHFKTDGLHALASAQSLSGLGLRVLLHFQHNDTYVGNRNEAELYNAFADSNPEHTYLLLGNDGGHIHPHESLARAIHQFYKKYGAAYDKVKLKEYEQYAQSDGQTTLLQPLVVDSNRIITAFHAACAAT